MRTSDRDLEVTATLPSTRPEAMPEADDDKAVSTRQQIDPEQLAGTLRELATGSHWPKELVQRLRTRTRRQLVPAAYMRTIMGLSQSMTCEVTGISMRTLRKYEHDPAVWRVACRLARETWAADLDARARRRLLGDIEKDDGSTARWYLERTDPELSPKGRVAVEGEVGVRIVVGGAPLGVSRDAIEGRDPHEIVQPPPPPLLGPGET